MQICPGAGSHVAQVHCRHLPPASLRPVALLPTRALAGWHLACLNFCSGACFHLSQNRAGEA